MSGESGSGYTCTCNGCAPGTAPCLMHNLSIASPVNTVVDTVSLRDAYYGHPRVLALCDAYDALVAKVRAARETVVIP